MTYKDKGSYESSPPCNMNLSSSVTHLCILGIGFVIKRIVICLITYGLTHMNFVLVYPTTKKPCHSFTYETGFVIRRVVILQPIAFGVSFNHNL